MRRLASVSILGCFLACGGRDRLLTELQSPRAHERALAVRKLGKMNRAQDVVLFSKATKDPSPAVRGEAAEALGKTRDIRVVDLLGELLGDNDESVQAKAATALAEIKGEKAKAYLILQYGRRSRPTRQAIIQALKAAKIPNAMTEAVATEAKRLWERNSRALADGATAERVAAAEDLGKSGRPEAVAQLLSLIHDRQVPLAAAAVRGLGYAGDRRAAGPIAELLGVNAPELREAACQALEQLDPQVALVPLKDVAIEKGATSGAALRALLSAPPSDEGNRLICDVVLNGAPAEALLAGKEMRARNGCALEPLLARLGKKSDLDALSSGLTALRALGPAAKDATSKLLPLFDHPDPQIRRLSLDAVAELRVPAASESVQRVLQREMKSIEPLRAAWIRQLPQTATEGFNPSAPSPGDSEAQYRARLSALFTRVQEARRLRSRAPAKPVASPNPPAEIVDEVGPEQVGVFAAALRAAGRFNLAAAKEVLLEHRRDSLPLIRAAAYAGLAFLQTTGPNDARDGLADPDRDVARATAEALADSSEAGRLTILHALSRLPEEKAVVLVLLEHVDLPTQAAASLIPLIAEAGPEVSIIARMLGRLRAEDAVAPLKKYLDDPRSEARRDVLWALGQIGDASASETVTRDLYSDTAEVRAAAADAAGRLSATNAKELLEALRMDYYRWVRETAQRALRKLNVAAEARK